jgi:hypothetical protein
MARRRRSRKRRSLGSTFAGVVILVLAGVGVWFGAQWAEGEGEGIFRSLERVEEGVEGSALEALPPDVRVRVEVLNAGGVPGMASLAKDELRELGFDVVYFGNAASFDAEESEVIHRGTDPSYARAVAEALGIESVRSEPDSTLLLDVTVRLGARWLSGEERRVREVDSHHEP